MLSKRGGAMRQAISFVVASAILAGGVYLLYLQIFHSRVIHGMALMGAGMAIAVGAGWLFGDFVLPRSAKRINKS